jgi:hypothetical protein
VDVLAPSVLDKCGHSKDRFKHALLSIVLVLSEVAPPDKHVPQLLATADKSKNSRSRVTCLEEVGFSKVKLRLKLTFAITAAVTLGRFCHRRSPCLLAIAQPS